MPENIRSLIVVLTLAVPAFYVGQQLARSEVAPREFAVWRIAWFVVTAVAFLSRSFLVVTLMMALTCLYAYTLRAATVALFFVLLFTVPLVSVPIGGFGLFNLLFDLNDARVLAIALLFPLLFVGRLGRQNGAVYALPDRLIVGYMLLMIALQFRQATNATQIMRGVVINTLDVLIPYFVFSRVVISTEDFRKVLLAFVIAVLPLSLIAVLETVKGWNLYASALYEVGGTFGNLRRAGAIRATASAGSPIALGFIIMVAIGCLLAVRQSTILSRRFAGIAFVFLIAGLVASLSRGPWVATMVLVFVYLATGPNAVAKLGKAAVIGAVALAALWLIPVGERLVDLFPFLGPPDLYRERLFDNAILVIRRSPWFGSIDYMSTPEMQMMIQGEGIIDIVNTYLQVALKSGLVGLGLFVGFFVTILIGLRRVLKFEVVRELGFDASIRASIATLVAMLVEIGTVSSVDFIPYVYWSFAGLWVALIRIAYRERATVMRAVRASRVPA